MERSKSRQRAFTPGRGKRAPAKGAVVGGGREKKRGEERNVFYFLSKETPERGTGFSLSSHLAREKSQTVPKKEGRDGGEKAHNLPFIGVWGAECVVTEPQKKTHGSPRKGGKGPQNRFIGKKKKKKKKKKKSYRFPLL